MIDIYLYFFKLCFQLLSQKKIAKKKNYYEKHDNIALIKRFKSHEKS